MMKYRVFAVLSLCCLLIFATGVMIAADHSHPKTGKVGTLTLTSPLRIGDKVLEPGEYEVQHFNGSSATGHFVQFTVIEYVGQTDVDGPTTPYVRRVVAQVPCKLEGLDKDAPQTIVKSESRHGVRLEIKGENVAHLM